MSIPEVTQTILDPGLGIVPANPGRTQVKAGVCSKGVAATLYSVSSIGTAKNAIGYGPLLEATARVLADAGGPVLLLPILPSSYGTVTGAFTQVGSGAGTVTGSKGPREIIKVKIGTGGALATATFQVAIGSGAYGALVTTGADPYTYQVPGEQFTKLAFAAGTYVANDVYTLNLDGTITRVGSGTATLLDGTTHSPVDAYALRVLITTAGALGAGAFKYSLDGGNTYSGTIMIPAGGKYAIAGTGIVLTFASTFVLDDLYTGTATAAGFSTGDVNTALTALLALPNEWGMLHIIGAATTVAAAVTLATAVGTQMGLAQTSFRYARAFVELSSAESDSTIAAGVAAYADKRVGIAAGDADIVSPVTGRIHRRNVLWTVMGRLSASKLSEHPGKVKLGALPGVRALYRDEAATPLLDEARFITLRTLIGKQGYYITRGRMMAENGSDFGPVQNCRVMDRACAVARAAYLEYLNDDVRIDEVTGFIDERDAQKIDANVTAKLEAALIDPDEVSSVSAQVSRTDNLLSTSTLNAEVSIVPKGYLEAIVVQIGFVNPVLAARAA
jgi:hypothetical protein